MALGQLGKQNNQLLDTLLQLNDLIVSLHGKDFVDHIAELKEKTEAYNLSKASTEPMIHALTDATRENEKSAAELKAEKNALASAKLEHDRRLQKIQVAQSGVDHAKNELEKKIALSEQELTVKSQSVASRETKALEKQKQADAIVAEYTQKLSDLKKITG